MGLIAFTIMLLSACNSLLTVDNPGRVTADALNDASIAPVLEAAAIQQAQCGIAQYAATAGMLSGEFISANGFVDNHIWEWRGVVEIKSAPGTCPASRATAKRLS